MSLQRCQHFQVSEDAYRMPGEINTEIRGLVIRVYEYTQRE
jgi:hypothetical protein